MESLPYIMGGLSILLAGSVAAWLKFSIQRTFKGMDDTLNNYKKDIGFINKELAMIQSRLGSFVTIVDCHSCKHDINKQQEAISTSSRNHDIDITKLQQLSANVDRLMSEYKSIGDLRSEFLKEFTRESHFLREMQSLASQIETIFAKINSIDGRLTSRGQ